MKDRKSSEDTTVLDCSPISNTCTDGKAGAFRLRRDERVGVRSRWFLSDPGSSPARARIQQLRRLLSDNDLYIKVKRMVYLSGRSDFKTLRNNCAAQHSELCETSHDAQWSIHQSSARGRRPLAPALLSLRTVFCVRSLFAAEVSLSKDSPGFCIYTLP